MYKLHYFQITINEQSGLNFLELLATTINTLSLCIEFKENPIPTSSTATSTSAFPEADTIHHRVIMKLMEEVLQYLNILIDYAPIESIECLRQLQKFMFKRNLASNLNGEYKMFYEIYKNGIINGIHYELFRTSLQNEYSSIDEKFAKNIKLFEPMVVYCLTVSIETELFSIFLVLS